MVARFRLFEDRRKGAKGDVFTLVDTKPEVVEGRKFLSYVGFNARPWDPQGIGQHGEFTHAAWAGHCAENCKSLGTRIGIEDVQDEELRAWILREVETMGGKAGALERGRNSLAARAARKAQKG